VPFLTDRGLGLSGIALLKGRHGQCDEHRGRVSRRLARIHDEPTSRLAHQRRRVRWASFVLYVVAALGVGGVGLLWVATIAEGVLGTMATVALFALMMDASDPEHAGTDYTLLACVVIVVGMLANYCGAAIADAFRLRGRIHDRRGPRVGRVPGAGLGRGSL
jgi:hypothetical protein